MKRGPRKRASAHLSLARINQLRKLRATMTQVALCRELHVNETLLLSLLQDGGPARDTTIARLDAAIAGMG